MTAKVAIFTIGLLPMQVDKLAERLNEQRAYVGKYSSESRLLEHAARGIITHLVLMDDMALNPGIMDKLKGFQIQIVPYKDAQRLL